MDNAITILSNEKIRLENLSAYARQRVAEVSSVAIVQKTIKDQNGEDRIVNYIDLEKFTPEQKQQFDLVCSRSKEIRARLSVFDNFVKSMAQQTNVNQYVEPLEEFKDVKIPCSNIDLDDNMQFTKGSIRVGPYNIESPLEMTFDQYAELYTSSLSKGLLNSLGNGLTIEQAMGELAKVCTEVYLHPPQIQVTEELNSGISKLAA